MYYIIIYSFWAFIIIIIIEQTIIIHVLWTKIHFSREPIGQEAEN